jgi:hypothetical protein
MAVKNIIEFDKKVLAPRDMVAAGGQIKPIRGFVVIETPNGNRHGENLVVLTT